MAKRFVLNEIRNKLDSETEDMWILNHSSGTDVKHFKTGTNGQTNVRCLQYEEFLGENRDKIRKDDILAKLRTKRRGCSWETSLLLL